MSKFNSIFENIKKMASSSYGKLIIIIFAIISILTFFLAITQNNGVAFSFFKGIVSSIISCFVILGVYFLITKIVGKDVIENSKNYSRHNSGETNNFSFPSDNFDVENPNEETPNEYESTPNQYNFDNNTFNKDDDKIDIDNFDLGILDNSKPSIIDGLNSVDKNSKVSYHNGASEESTINNNNNGDSVLLSDKTEKKRIESSLTDNSFIDFSADTSSSNVTTDSETMAKAVRTMRSKDEDE